MFISDPNHWDFITGQHGSYEICRQVKHCLKYTTKCGNYVQYKIDVPVWFKANKSKNAYGFEIACKSIQEGKTLIEIDKKHPGFVGQHLYKLEKYVLFQEAKKRK